MASFADTVTATRFPPSRALGTASLGAGSLINNAPLTVNPVTGTTQIVDGGLTVGKPWRDQTAGFTEHRPIRLYAPGTYS